MARHAKQYPPHEGRDRRGRDRGNRIRKFEFDAVAGEDDVRRLGAQSGPQLVFLALKHGKSSATALVAAISCGEN